MPPTTQSLRHPLTRVHYIAQRIKTARRSRRKTPDDKMISWKKAESNLPKQFCMVGTRHFASAPNIRYGTKLWADVKYHVPTGFGFSPKASGFYPFGDATALAGEGGVRGVVWLIQAQLEIRHATALTTGAKHWHRQKAVFYVFVSVPPVFFH